MSNFILLHVKNQLFQDHLLKRLLFSCWMIWYYPTSLVAQMVKHLTTMQEIRIQSLGWEDLWRRKWQPIPLFLPGESPWTEEPGGLQSWTRLSDSHTQSQSSPSLLGAGVPMQHSQQPLLNTGDGGRLLLYARLSDFVFFSVYDSSKSAL